jgi:hypothetical protein
LKALFVTVIGLAIAGCGATTATRSDEVQQVRIEQRLSSGETIRMTARDRSDEHARGACGTLSQVENSSGADFCLQARRPEQAGIATVFVSRGRLPAITTALLVPERAGSVEIETVAGGTFRRGEVNSAMPGYAMGLAAVAGTTTRMLPARLVVRDRQGHALMRSDWIPRDTCRSARFDIRACTLQVQLDRVA